MKRKLVAEAVRARENSYCKYSQFAVGAALLTTDGTIYRGANVENASFGLTNCAERSAFFAAVSDGKRSFEAIAIAGGPFGQKTGQLCAPCGACRQVMAEFGDPNKFLVLLGTESGYYEEKTIEELLPGSFGKEMQAGTSEAANE